MVAALDGAEGFRVSLNLFVAAFDCRIRTKLRPQIARTGIIAQPKGFVPVATVAMRQAKNRTPAIGVERAALRAGQRRRHPSLHRTWRS